MQIGRHSRSHGLVRLEPIASLEHVGSARVVARQEREGGRAGWPLFPKRFDFVVGVLKVGDDGAPICEERSGLCRCAALTRDGENIPYSLRQRIGHYRSCVGGDRQAEPAEIIVHEIIAVPAAMILRELNQENGPARKANVRGALEDSFALLIAPARAGIYAPGGLLFPVDSESHRTGDAFLARLIFEVWLERSLWWINVGGRLLKFDGNFFLRIFGIHDFDFELGKRTGAFEGTPRRAARQ